MIEEHVAATGSEKGQMVLDHFSEYLPKFKKIISYDYSRDVAIDRSDGRERFKL